MLIPLEGAIKRHNLKIRGVIHVGGHHGQEFDDYVKAGIQHIAFIEPCNPAFEILRTRFSSTPGVSLFQCALGVEEEMRMMNVETRNTGMSNSLLRPVTHLHHYPDIQFTTKQAVEVRRLDNLKLERSNFNLLMMDVQGFEKFVVMGGMETLRHVDYVYSEVNNAELYEGCTRVEELDKLLSEFERVETKWTSHGWGDAIYVRKKNVVKVPEEFRPHIRNQYPPDNDLIFEEWFYRNFNGAGRTYLPIFWTGYYVNNQYGKCARSKKRLQDFLSRLDRSKKYFTIVQYDDGILNDISHLDIKVFAMCGPRIDFPIPLLCPPHKLGPVWVKKYLANFVGRHTHPIREKMMRELVGREDVYCSDAKHSMEQFTQILQQSTFTLCPRGYGMSSFRIVEAMQALSIPVYISDKFVFPFNMDFNEYGVAIEESFIPRLMHHLAGIDRKTIVDKQKRIAELLKTHFCYEATAAIIQREAN